MLIQVIRMEAYRSRKEISITMPTTKKQAKKVKTPVLLFQAGKDTLVTPGAQKEFIKRIPDGQLVVVPDIRHEIYRAPNSVLQPYLEMIFEFYDSGEKVL